MRVVEIQGRFGLDQLALVERAKPEPKPGQVLLRMTAAALNRRDLLMVRGDYNPKQPLPLIPCSDGVGVVVAVGDGVESFKVGERVSPIFSTKWICGQPTRERLRSTLGGPLDGTLAELMLADAEALVRPPEHLSDEEAATLPCAAVTAWNALVTLGSVRAGDTILVQGTGGVSIFALQFAKLLGARVILTSAHDEKLERAAAMGAWETINYKRTPDWGKQALKLTGGHGVDLVVEVGGAGTLEQSLAAVRPGGQISLIGVLAGAAKQLSVTPVFMRQIRIQGILVGPRETFEQMNRALAAHPLKPVVDRVFQLAEFRAAFEHLDAGRHFGKVCIRIA